MHFVFLLLLRQVGKRAGTRRGVLTALAIDADEGAGRGAKKTSERGKGAQFTLEGGYILSCLCICYLFIQLPESAVHLGWVWCLHVFVSCLNVSVVCTYVRACVPGVRPQPPFEEHIILSESSTASRSSFPSLSFFSSNDRCSLLMRNPPAHRCILIFILGMNLSEK